MTTAIENCDGKGDDHFEYDYEAADDTQAANRNHGSVDAKCNTIGITICDEHRADAI